MIPADHPLRHALNDEIHARPPEALVSPQRFSYIALSAEGERERRAADLVRLIERFGGPPLGRDQNHYSADFGPFRVKWESHTEFFRYTFYVDGVGSDPFGEPAIRAVPQDWLADLGGQTIAAIHGALIPRPEGVLKFDALSDAYFGGHALVGAKVAGGAGKALTDFRIHADGFGRVLLLDTGMTPRQAGRVVQRLLEIDTYRTMALLTFPVARGLSPFLQSAEAELLEIVAAMQSAGEEEEPVLLDRLTRLEAQIERRHSDTHYRFSAANAYYDLIEQRIEELREQRIEGLQTLREFNERRLSPAIATCRATATRLQALSERVARTTVLLSTRVNVTRERQNQAVLKSMDRRATLQLRLQQTVEGLSVAAISYYIVGLIGYAAKGAKALGLELNTDGVTASSIPLVVAAVAYGLVRFHRSLEKDTKP